jgi:hypothetical protein
MHVRLIGAGDIKVNGFGAGCEQQLVEGDASPTRKRHLASLCINPGDVAAQLKVDRLVFIKLGRPERHPLFRRVSRKIVLRAIWETLPVASDEKGALSIARRRKR